MRVHPKLNIGLRVIRKRPDGYHDLETLFVPCTAFGDELEITPKDVFSIRIDKCDWDPLSDLTAAAYRLLRDEFGIPPVSIELHKGIPVGAGLGGGSADAAAALILLNDLFSLSLGKDDLAARAAKLGSDCPFFIYNRPMIGEGRGEILTPYEPDLSAYRIDVRVPEGVHVSTKEAYSGVRPRFDGNRRQPWKSLRELLDAPVEQWRDNIVNDFEPSVFAAHPEIAALKEQFYREGAVYAAMSGSGSSVFGIFKK